MMDEGWRDKIRRDLDRHGLHMKTVSLEAGFGETFVRDMLERDREPAAWRYQKVLDTIARLIDEKTAYASTPNAIPASIPMPNAAELPKDIPVLGTVAGSNLQNGAFQLSSDAVDYVRRPPALAFTRDVYALYVQGDSMSPKYEAGELIFINPHRPVQVGDYVVIQEPVGDDHVIQSFVKRLVKRTATTVTVEQLNPHVELHFKRSPALVLHHVMTTAELFGM